MADPLRAFDGARTPAVKLKPAPTVNEVPVSSVDVTPLSEVEPRAVEWFWRSRIPLGSLSVIAGDPATGKSTLSINIAARSSSGTSWPDSRDEPNPAGDVIIVSGEDGIADCIRPRLDAACGDPSRVFVLNGIRRAGDDYANPIQLDRDMRHLADVIRSRAETRLLILDPLDSFLGESCDSHRKADVQRVLSGLNGLAEDHGVAVLGILHLRKSSGDKGLYRVMGSLGFVSTPRCAWAVSRDKQDPKRRLFTCIKNNLAPDPSGLAFTIEDAGGVGVVHWSDETVAISADEALEYDWVRIV
jgi:AAA domain